MIGFVGRFIRIISIAGLAFALADALSGHYPAAALVLATSMGGLVVASKAADSPLAVTARPPAAAKPVPFEPRDPRTGLDPADPANAHLLGICPLCGMEDADRLSIIEDTTWHGWPAHWACAQTVQEPDLSRKVKVRLTIRPGEDWEVWAYELPNLRAQGLLIEDSSNATPSRSWRSPGRRLAPGEVAPARGMTIRVGGAAGDLELVIPRADSRLPRIDYVTWCAAARLFEVICGEPAPVPLAPCLPPSRDLLARVLVFPGATDIPACNITDVRDTRGGAL